MNRSFKFIYILVLITAYGYVHAENKSFDKESAIKKLSKLKVKLNTEQWLKNAASGDLRILKIMHDAGFKLDEVDSIDHSGILHHASANGKNLVVSWVLKQFIDPRVAVNRKDINGFTALDWAAYHGRVETVSLLLDNHANPNLHSSSNNPLLTFAIQSGSLQTVKALLDFEPNLVRTSFGGQNSVSTAKLAGNKTVIDWINQVLEKAE